MEGINKIQMNQLEMQKAIQHYLDTVVFKNNQGKVTLVKSETSNYGQTFEITIDGATKTEQTMDTAI